MRERTPQVLIVLTVPAIALFGFLLGELSGLATNLIAALTMRITGQRSINPEAQARRWSNMLRNLDINNDGYLTLNEILIIAPSLFGGECGEGVDMEDHKEFAQLGRAARLVLEGEPEKAAAMTAANESGVFGEVETRRLFLLADTNHSGALDRDETIGLLSLLSETCRIHDKRRLAHAEMQAMILLCFALIIFCALCFTALEENWTLVDGLYFVIITLSTVGLGDFTPDLNNGLTFGVWILMIVGGLGVATSVIGAISSYVQAIWLQETLAQNEVKLLRKDDPDLQASKERRRKSAVENTGNMRMKMKRGMSFSSTAAVSPSAKYEVDGNGNIKEGKEGV